MIFGKIELIPITIPNNIIGIILTPVIFLLMKKIIRSKMREGIVDSIYIATDYKSISKIRYNKMIWVVQKDLHNPKHIHISYTPYVQNVVQNYIFKNMNYGILMTVLIHNVRLLKELGNQMTK